MILVDTSVWIKFLRNHAPYRSSLRKIIEDDKVVMPDVVAAELLQGAADERDLTVIESYRRHLRSPVIPEPLLPAGRYTSEHRLSSRGIGIIDAVLIVAARQSGAAIWTLDRKLTKYLEDEDPGILYREE